MLDPEEWYLNCLPAPYGEALLRAVFLHACLNGHDHAYVTAFPKHVLLFGLFAEFGFETADIQTRSGEAVCIKHLRPRPADEQALSPLDFAVRFGPCHASWHSVPAWAVPIRPHYDGILFPDRQTQRTLFREDRPYGNAIRKAYLCRSPVRAMEPGALLAFYLSGGISAVVSIGVLERAIASSDVDRILRLVQGRTVYLREEIERMCRGPREVLALRFRQVLREFPPIPLRELVEHGALLAAPQSITKVSRESLGWLRARTGL